MRVNERGYLERLTSRKCYRNWWLITDEKQITVTKITIPQSLVGKRIRFKVEVIKDEENIFYNNGDIKL